MWNPVSIVRLVLCKRTTARTLTAGPCVAVEPGSEIIRGRTNVDDPAVPDRLVLCHPWWLKPFSFSLQLTSLADCSGFLSPAQSSVTIKEKKMSLIYFGNILL